MDVQYNGVTLTLYVAYGVGEEAFYLSAVIAGSTEQFGDNHT